MRTLTLLMALAPGFAQSSVSIFVAPNGNDANSGLSSDKPFATISRARDEIRRMRSKGAPTVPVTVYLVEACIR